MRRTEAIFRATAAAFLIALAGSAARDADAQAASCTPGPQTEVVTGADIVRYALSRLSDVFTLSATWHAASTDAYHWHAAPAGAVPGPERWTVYVDDVPVAPRLLGRNQLNALPIPIFDIECIELVSGPDLRRTTFSQTGSIRIYTDTPDFGLSFEGGVGAGNEINDPGPFRYTPMVSENVDRVGPIGAGGISVNATDWTARATGRLDEFHVTDEVLIERVRRLFSIDSKPRINVRSVGLTGSIGPPDRRHHVVAGRTETGDLAFFPSVGHEIPTDHHLDVAGGSGRVPFTGGDVLYAASYTRGALKLRPNRADADLGWRQTRIAAEAETRLNAVRFGGGVHATDAGPAARLVDSRLLTTRLFGGLHLPAAPGWRQDLVVEWKQRNNRAAAAAYAAADVRMGEHHRMTVTASYGNVLPDEQGLWMWLDRGYSLPMSDSVRIDPFDDKPLTRLSTADAVWTSTVADGLRIGLRSFYRRVEHEFLPVHDIAYDPAAVGFDVETHVKRDAWGSSAGGSVSIDLAIRSLLHQEVTYTIASALLGDRTYRDLHARVPTHRVTYAATYAPVDRFSLSALVRYTSGISWPSFKAASVQSRGKHPWQLPRYLLIDVSAAKRMWKDHLVVSLALKNVLDEPLRFHPAGAVYHMALHFAVRLNVTSETGF